MAHDKLNWGIMGTGNIARQFSIGVNGSRLGRLAAVGSRNAESAKTFAATHQIAVAHGSYEALLADPTVDAIYVSLPNALHQQWTLAALAAGKHVLCEKPFAIDVAQSQEMFAAADKAGRLLAEGFMYRCHPLTHAVVAAVRKGEIGEVKLIRSSFCYRTTRIDGNIRFDSSLAGGGLMDVGCYCINFARLIAGCEPVSMQAIAQRHASGVDHVAAGMLLFENGIVSSFTCGMSVQADNTAYICGTEGFIEVPIPWKPPARNAVYVVAHGVPPRMDLAKTDAAGLNAPSAPNSSPRETRCVDAGMDLFALEADDFARSVLQGAPPRITRADTLGNMQVLQTLLQQI